MEQVHRRYGRAYIIENVVELLEMLKFIGGNLIQCHLPN